MLVRLESWEAKWLTRLLLREYGTVQLDEMHLLRQCHFLLPDLLMFQNDFDAAFALLKGDLAGFPHAQPRLAAEERDMRIEAARKLRPVVGIKVGRPSFSKARVGCFFLVGCRLLLMLAGVGAADRCNASRPAHPWDDSG